jgi:hypothetical protein
VLADVAGAVLTAGALLSLGAGGYLLALTLEGRGSRADSLSLAIAALLCATAEGVLWAVLLGVLGVLRIELALGAQTLLALVLWLRLRRASHDVWLPARTLLREVGVWARAHPAPVLIAVAAASPELIRALLRPPLSWDSLEYHLLLAASWLRSHELGPVLAPYRTNFQSLYPANGSLWLWWWLAPSHSELYVNWAFVPQWLLLAFATGGVARELGAARSWPLASVVVALLPVILRFATTQYVDIFLAAAWLSALFYLLRWLREPDPRSAYLAGLGLGLVAGSKLHGIPYAAALGVSAVLFARSRWRERLPQLALGLAASLVVGSYFYLRNLWIGVGLLFPSTSPLGFARILCDHTLSNPVGMGPFAEYTLLARWGDGISAGDVVDAFLGTAFSWSQEMGVGPLFLPLVFAALVFPVLAARERRATWLCASQLVFLAVFWVAVPTTEINNLYANVRYLDAALAIAVAFAFALLETRGLPERWIEAISVAASAQTVLFIETPASFSVRLGVSLVLLVVLVHLLSPRARDLARRHARRLAVAAAAFALAIGAPSLAHFRERDRYRAFTEEYTVHRTPVSRYAEAWSWLDQHAGAEPVAAVTEVRNWLFPPMGMRLQRDVRYVNYNAANLDSVTGYPNCNPRVDPDPAAWIANLRRQGIRWVLTSRDDRRRPFPVETRWATERPELFELRYSDDTSRIFAFTAEPAAAEAAPAP